MARLFAGSDLVAVRVLAVAGLAGACLFVAACSSGDSAGEPAGGREEPARASVAPPEVQELAVVGGAQDLWPFEFGFDATRETVRSALGDPDREEQETLANDNGSSVVTWHLPRLEFSFLVDQPDDIEYLISVRIESPDVGLGGVVHIGMDRNEVTELMGEPALETDGSLLYFYLASTVEVLTDGERVTGAVLSRAMP